MYVALFFLKFSVEINIRIKTRNSKLNIPDFEVLNVDENPSIIKKIAVNLIKCKQLIIINDCKEQKKRINEMIAGNRKMQNVNMN